MSGVPLLSPSDDTIMKPQGLRTPIPHRFMDHNSNHKGAGVQAFNPC